MANKNKPKRKGLNAKGRNKGDGQYLPIPYTMAQSTAFRSLSGIAIKAWIEIRCRYNGQNNGMLSLSLRQAADLLGMSQTSAKRALDELVDKGFLKRRSRGQWYGRKAAEYIATDCGFDGNFPTRDWQQWTSKNKTSVSSRTAKRSNGSPEYREPKFAVQRGSRQPHLKVIDGAA